MWGGGQCGLQRGEYGGPKGAVSAEVSSAALAVCHYLMVNPFVSGGGSSTGPPARRQIEIDFVVARMQRGFGSSYAAVRADGSWEVWKHPLIPPGISLARCKCKQRFSQTKFSVSRQKNKKIQGKDGADEIKAISGRWSLKDAILGASQSYKLRLNSFRRGLNLYFEFINACRCSSLYPSLCASMCGAPFFVTA